MFLLIVIVYVGAIIIFIGYICAVCPNFIIIPSYRYSYLLALSLFSYLFFYRSHYAVYTTKTGSLLDFFISNWGLPIFVIVALMLFSTLLIVTSQYSSPQGPFRSI